MKKLAVLLFSILPIVLFSQQNSVLSNGDWYKFAVEETGVFKLTYNELQTYGIDVDNIDPQNLALFGNPAGMLPELLEEPYDTDLQQIAIQFIGEDDGSFDAGDYILFYAQSPHLWEYDSNQKQFYHRQNLYTEQTHYFLTLLDSPGKRIPIQESEPLPHNQTIDTLKYLTYHENEWENIGNSGKDWFGEFFDEQLNYSFEYNLTGCPIYTDGHQFRCGFAARSFEPSTFSVDINETIFNPIEMPQVSSQNRYQLYRDTDFDAPFSLSSTQFSVSITYHPANEFSIAWLDYFELKLKMKPQFFGDQMILHAVQSVGIGNISLFALQSAQPEELTIWNVSDPLDVKEMELAIATDSVWFKVNNEELLEFHVFNGNEFYTPAFIGQIENQSLHAFSPPDLLIISHPDFLSQANQLAAFHESEDEMTVVTFTVDQIYNEFSSGSQDVTAIRNLIRHFWEQSENDQNPKYVLLFGDASYDYLDRVDGNTNFVPTYESWESANIVNSYPTDDYFGMKNPGSSEDVKLGVGRLPVTTVAEANRMLAKIESYASQNTLSPYKNEWLFIADDGDANRHLKDAEVLTQFVDTNNPAANITKAYFDFFELISTDEGPRYPEVNQMINDKVNEGQFYVNYSGHGGATSMGRERVLTKDDVETWLPNNIFSLWVTASCDMAWYDNPAVVSLAETILLKSDAGAMGFIGGSRPTYAGANLMMNKAIIEKLTDPIMQSQLRFGDLMRHALERTNDEKWVLLGDPALKVPFPEFHVNTTSVNATAIADFTDTIPPESYLFLHGEILSKSEGVLQAGFIGTVYLKVFAPRFSRSTLGNQYGSDIVDIEVQDSVLASGTASVENGEFAINVKLPSGYYEGFGNLKLSWYAENGETDANGFNNQLIFGGEPNAIAEGNLFLDQIKVYPTVFADYIYVEKPVSKSNQLSYHIYNTMGVEMFSVNRSSAQGRERIELSGLSKGMYILNVGLGADSRNFKLFRQ